MTKQLPILTITFATLVLVAGCSRMAIDAGAHREGVFFTRDAGGAEYTRLGDFSAAAKGSWLFWGLSPREDADLQAILSEQMARYHGDAIVNLEITTIQTFSDGFISAITLGIYSRRTMEVSGTVVKLSEQASFLPVHEVFAAVSVAPDGSVTYRIRGPVTLTTQIIGLAL